MLRKLRKIGVKASACKFFSRLFPKDKAILSACARIGAFRYLKKYQKAMVPVQDSNIDSVNVSKKQMIWVCWLQGFDNAPLLVKKCRDSVLRYHSNCEVVLLDESSVSKYIDIPDYVAEKYKKGIISHAHFSDFVRISLLAKHGGIWIDSTVLLSDDIPDYILNADLFCFKEQPLGKVVASNWFIAAKPRNPIVLNVMQLLGEYWKCENKLVSYSIFHLFWTMAVYANDTNWKLWETVPYFDDINCKILQMELFKPFSQERFDQIKTISPIHKLTYKFDDRNTFTEDTFFDYLTKH